MLEANSFGRPKAEDWVNRLKEFKMFMINLPKKPSIKVALLDDGAKLTALKGKQIGECFCPGKPAYFVGPCEHGTEMARCIREICPMAELYIARLDNSGELENQKFTIMSCHQVRTLTLMLKGLLSDIFGYRLFDGRLIWKWM